MTARNGMFNIVAIDSAQYLFVSLNWYWVLRQGVDSAVRGVFVVRDEQGL